MKLKMRPLNKGQTRENQPGNAPKSVECCRQGFLPTAAKVDPKPVRPDNTQLLDREKSKTKWPVGCDTH